MSKWCYILDENFELKAHLCTGSSAAAIIAHMAVKNAKPKLELRNKPHFEPGGYGMRSTVWPRFDIVFLGYTLELEADKVVELFSDLKTKTEPDFSSAGKNFYYSISRMNVLVVSTEERTELLHALEGKLQEANAAADKFLAEFEESWAKMAENYKEKHGKDFPLIRVPFTTDKTAN